jgi:ketosteroid isomerase-like protein
MIRTALLALAAAGAAAAGQPRTVAGALAAEDAWVAALTHRDVAALADLLDPDFADSAWNGALYRRQAILDALPHRPSANILLSDLDARVFGDTAVVRGVNTVRKPDGQVEARIRFTDVFRYRDGAWRAISAQETPILAKSR